MYSLFSNLFVYSFEEMAESEKTTALNLQRILQNSEPTLPSSHSIQCRVHDVDCSEVYPGVFIGDASSARNKEFLRLVGITHVLNAAEGSRFGQVDTGRNYYRSMPKIAYKGFRMMDHPTTDISIFFNVAAQFIENAVNSGGKVLVHCLVGVSRSATCVLAYLMISKKMTAVEALKKVRMHRHIRPNDGFLQQLADLDNKLKDERNTSS